MVTSSYPAKVQLPVGYSHIQASFDLMLDTINRRDRVVTDRATGRELTIDELVSDVLQTANERAGGPLTPEQIAMVSKMTAEAEGLTGNKLVQLFTKSTKTLSGPLADRVIFDPTYPQERTYRYVLEYFRRGCIPEDKQSYYNTFHPDIAYITNGVTGEVTEGKDRTIVSLQAKDAKVPPGLVFEIFPALFCYGNFAITLVKNTFPDGRYFTIASVNVIDGTPGPNEGKMLVNIDMGDFVSEVARLAEDFIHRPGDLLTVVEQNILPKSTPDVEGGCTLV